MRGSWVRLPQAAPPRTAEMTGPPAIRSTPSLALPGAARMRAAAPNRPLRVTHIAQ